MDDAGATRAFGRSLFSRSSPDYDEEEALRWAALEKLPTYDRMRRAVVHGGAAVDGHENTEMEGLVDINRLASGEAGRALLERVFQDDSERFLRRLRDRVDRVGIDLPAIEVRYQGLSVQVDAFVGSRALPTLWNSATNILQVSSMHILSFFFCGQISHHLIF